MTQNDTLPTIRLKPKMNAQKLRFGFPWVFQNELVMDRRSRALAVGSIVQVTDSHGGDLGIAGYNPNSKISARILARSGDVIDANWFEARLRTALELRERLYDTPYYRLIHAEADGLPGVIIDRFDDHFAIQPNAAWAEVHLDGLIEGLERVCAPAVIVKNASSRARKTEGLDDQTLVLRGDIDAPLPVPMNGATYLADLIDGQKTGLFFDQRDNHAFAARLSKGAEVLDVFSHVGGFGLAAIAGGANSALCVDGSAIALELAEQGAAAMGVQDKLTTLKGDAFDVMKAMASEGREFDVVVCDPPAFAPTKQTLEAGLRAYERVARAGAALVRKGGYLVLCSCSHAADLERFRASSLAGIGKGGRRAQIVHFGAAGPDHPSHPYLSEVSYLKALFLRIE